jgi:hypothetical protein
MSDEQTQEQEQEQEQDTTNIRLEAIKQAFTDASNEEGNDEDAVKLKMIQAGAKFSEVTRLFNLFMVEFGFTKSKEEKQSALEDILTGEDLTNEDAFNTCSEKLMERLEVSDKSANAMIRQWAKRNDVEYFKPVKETVASETINDRVFSWIDANIDATNDDLIGFLETLGSNNVINKKLFFINIFKFAKSIKAKYAS